MAQISLPPAAQQLLLQLQTAQQQGQAISIQHESLTIQKMEIEKALEELKKTKDSEEVFKAVGPILVKSTKSNLTKELGEKKESIEMRLSSLEKQDAKLREKVKELQTKLQELLRSESSKAN